MQSKSSSSLILYPLYSFGLLSVVMWVVLSSAGEVQSSLVMVHPSLVCLSSVMDLYSVSFSAAVAVIASSIFLYSSWYMSGEAAPLRFMSLVAVFVSSMLVLITSTTPFTLIIGWDGLGVSSYFLVVYYENYKASGAGTTTLLSNRVGDVFMVLVFITLVASSTHLPYSLTSPHLLYADVLAPLVLLAAITKSAMYPYSTWLPEAMAAPTPVSSLVHSSTLVTAGVYLLIRFTPIMAYSSTLMLGALSSFTLLVASLYVGLCMDFKKIIALSTLSQLCFMMIPIAMCAHSVAMTHLISHAFFKSALFMSAGSLIHLSASSQEGRATPSPSTPMLSAMLITCASLAGVAPLSGFMTKEYVLFTVCTTPQAMLLVAVLVLGCFMSVLYSARLLGFFMYPSTNMAVSSSSTGVGMAYTSLLLVSFSIMAGVVLITTMPEAALTLPPITALMVKLMFGCAITLALLWLFKAPSWYKMQASFSGLGSMTTSTVPVVASHSAMRWLFYVDKGALEHTIPQSVKSTLRITTPSLYALSTSPMLSMMFSVYSCVLLYLCIYA